MKQSSNINQTKIINSRCKCGIGLSWTNEQVIMLEPCEHIIHKKCLEKINNKECPLCGSLVKKYYGELELKKKERLNNYYYQKYVDIISIKNIDNLSKKDMNKFLMNVPEILELMSKLPFIKGFDEGHKICEDALSVANVRIKVIGKNYIKGNNIIISNHTSVMDFMILFYIFKCGFLASSSIKETWLGNLISNIIPILFIDRGKEKNTVKKIKKYVSNKSLCIFPEGLMVHPDTLAQFRTGSFYAEKSILPVTISYNPFISDSSISEFVKKIMSQDIIDVTVNILPIEHPPFDNFRINTIRKKMAKIGNLALSRISNRDAIDKSYK